LKKRTRFAIALAAGVLCWGLCMVFDPSITKTSANIGFVGGLLAGIILPEVIRRIVHKP